MNQEITLMKEASQYNTQRMLEEWKWLVPNSDTPLFVSAFGDWVFGNPDGSLWALSVLEGNYEKVANNSAEYNTLNKSQEWLDQVFIASWLQLAASNGLLPSNEECIGWKVHPIMGGKFEVSNLKLFNMEVYQSIMGQMHRQVKQHQAKAQKKKPWYKLW